MNAAVFLALYRFCRETEAYRPAAVTPWIAYALAFKAGRRHCTDDEQRLLFEEFEEEVEAAYLSAGLGHGRTDWPPWKPAGTRGSP
ncbi:MAG: hypothetical protein IPI51_08935 [Betaproteobacteria bacterium]|nr:hypothetical protein [Betaproteobacteria bacterium]MBL0299314.1 hypothetical protein [Betaproteobacteria bacterium]